MSGENALKETKQAIRAKALELGFDTAGFADAAAGPDNRRHLEDYLAQGRHGTMGWMAAHPERRASPQALWPAARSVVVLGANYGPSPGSLAAPPDKGLISAYARFGDYHKTIKKRLKGLGRWMAGELGGEFKVFVDTAPVMEKPLAAAAGLGWQGKHTNLVSRRFGSWLFLGEIFTTAELPPDDPHADLCGSCEECLKACPTGALDAPYRIDSRRCISYLTIEHKGAIEDGLARLMGNRVFGCDDCLAACPWNKFAQMAEDEAFSPRRRWTEPGLARLAGLDEDAFADLFAGSPVKRTGRERLARNALIAAANGRPPGIPATAGAARQRLTESKD